MTLTTIPCLLYFAALFLTVATLWILLYADPNEGLSPQNFFVSVVVVMPFVMLVNFGLAVIICNKISVARGWPTALPLQLSSAEGRLMTHYCLSIFTVSRSSASGPPPDYSFVSNAASAARGR